MFYSGLFLATLALLAGALTFGSLTSTAAFAAQVALAAQVLVVLAIAVSAASTAVVRRRRPSL